MARCTSRCFTYGHPYTNQLLNRTARCRALSYLVEPPPGVPEKVTSVLLVPGGWSRAAAWLPAAKHLAQRGYPSHVLEYSLGGEGNSEATCWRRSVSAIARATRHLGPQVVVVASGLGGFYAQKALESHSFAGMVLVGSIPPHPKRVAESLLGVSDDEAAEKLGGGAAAAADEFNPPPRRAISELLEISVRLEPGAVPTLVLGCADDEVVTKEETAEVAAFHGAQWSDELAGMPHEVALSPGGPAAVGEAVAVWLSSGVLSPRRPRMR